MDGMYTRQGDICIVPVIPRRLVSRGLQGIQCFIFVEIVLDNEDACTATTMEPRYWSVDLDKIRYSSHFTLV